MTKARSQQIDLQATPYYHCISRCVRRAFLCGDDKYSGANFDHRKDWIVERLRLLGEVFAIDIAAYAIMSNHYHLVLHVNREETEQLSDEQVIERWLRLYKGPLLVRKFQSGFDMTAAERDKVAEIVATWRDRLSSISWFMSCLNEYIAKQANKEDNCKGHFWEGRFKSQALLDETALLSCMAYVDLNPVRAAITEDLETSDFTSIQDRMRQVSHERDNTRPKLLPFIEAEHAKKQITALPFNLKDYIDLVDWTGRCVRDDKRGFLPPHIEPILARINLTEEQWKVLCHDIQKQSITMLHGIEQMEVLERASPKRQTAYWTICSSIRNLIP